MGGHEFAVLAAEGFAETDRRVAAKVREPFSFLFTHVIVVGQPGAAHRRPPLFGTDSGRVGVADSVANVVVITDRIEGLAFGIVGAALEQLRVEDLLLDVGVHVELVGERAPHAFEGALVDRSLRLQIVQLRELVTEPVMVGEDQHGDVSSHCDSPPSLSASPFGRLDRRCQTRRQLATPSKSPVDVCAGVAAYGRAVTITYDETLRERFRVNLASHDRRTMTDPTKRHAAVAVVVVDSNVGEDRVDPAPVDDWIAGRPMEAGLDGRMVGVSGGGAFLLCRRASRLSSHAAQWALPGGRLDPGETPVDAALRELDEEVGIRLPGSMVLGMLDDYPTRSGYVITPVVIWGGGKLDPRPAPDEVVAVYRVGLHQLQRDDSPRFITIPESPHPVVQIPLGNDLIHAPTGAVLLQLRWLCLEGRHDPVDELEQPVFAWK